MSDFWGGGGGLDYFEGAFWIIYILTKSTFLVIDSGDRDFARRRRVTESAAGWAGGGGDENSAGKGPAGGEAEKISLDEALLGARPDEI